MAAKKKRAVICNEELIELIRERPAIYNITHAEHKDRVKRDAAWWEVASLYYQNWSSLCQTEQSSKLKDIQRRWCSMKVGFNRYLRKEKEMPSGSGAKLNPYIHARELDFLRPILEMREKQASRPDGNQDEEEEAEVEQQEEVEEEQDEEEVLEDHVLEGPDSEETSRHLSPMPRGSEQPGPSNRRISHSLQAARGHGRGRGGVKTLVNLLQAVKEMFGKMEEVYDEDVAFGNLLIGLFRQIEPEHKLAMRSAVLEVTQSFMKMGLQTAAQGMQVPSHHSYIPQYHSSFQHPPYRPYFTHPKRPYCNECQW